MNTCPKCGTMLNPTDQFCGSCGSKRELRQVKKEKESVQQVLVFYITFLVFAIVSYVIYQESDALVTEIVLESVFVLLTVLFSFFDLKNILRLYTIRYINWKNLVFSIVFPILTAGVVYFGIEWLNEVLEFGNYNLFYDYMDYENSFLWAFLFVVILPPIFEELAFRGYLFNQLLNVTNAKVTILATAFIFALVHFSFISFLWIFPFGIVLGYLRHRYRTLWLGMIVHFIHNMLVLLLEYYYFSGDPLLDFL